MIRSSRRDKYLGMTAAMTQVPLYGYFDGKPYRVMTLMKEYARPDMNLREYAWRNGVRHLCAYM